jgi:hypothetical protein
MAYGGINPFIDRDDVLSQIVGEFAARDPAHPNRRRALKQKLVPLTDQVRKLQESGHPMGCAEQTIFTACRSPTSERTGETSGRSSARYRAPSPS